MQSIEITIFANKYQPFIYEIKSNVKDSSICAVDVCNESNKPGTNSLNVFSPKFTYVI